MQIYVKYILCKCNRGSFYATINKIKVIKSPALSILFGGKRRQYVGLLCCTNISPEKAIAENIT